MSVPLEAIGLSVGYEVKGQAARHVASDLSVQLKAGEFVCLLGPNGVGKSTLIRTLSGMQKPLAGRIRISDTEIEQMSPKEKARAVSVVLTDSLPQGMFDAYSVVALGRHPHTSWTGSLGDKDRARIEWALKAVGATELAYRQVSELSDGERQKVVIARALTQETNLILLDEPTAFLDLPRRVELMRTLRDLARVEGLSILLSTHDLDLALRSADKLWLLDGAGKLTTGMPEELALDGCIASTFTSNEVDWDSEQGAFRMHNHTCATVSLEGNGAAAVWTRRALTRIGYEVVDNADASKLRIRIVETDGDLNWDLETNGEVSRKPTLQSLVRHLLGQEHIGLSERL
ncbi:ABC transporter ATP-binding protein [Pelagicoccus sp. SDUM812002]|uniref:ABC transporter ATP-binding protein n=1 Tax=Pelagicoccus sp. SDUM812002 TaxID=3041266 RepID=UPI00280E866D|nr:ABC transporter ATP-binding protein [Pelagicoccus sp. SDUM812002]MDQ8187532.1 ABC transporter ATP-binding protein [Pelagicoccus sp. SDUM812002]